MVSRSLVFPMHLRSDVWISFDATYWKLNISTLCALENMNSILKSLDSAARKVCCNEDEKSRILLFADYLIYTRPYKTLYLLQEREQPRMPYTRGATCCLQDNFFNFFRMASTTLRLVDYDFQRFQDRFDYSSDYWLVDHDLKKFPRCARPVPLKKGFITAFPFIKGLRFFSRAARGHFPL